MFQSQGDPFTILVDGQDLTCDFVALLEQLAGMPDLAGPGHVTDVQQAIDTFLEFDESTVIGEVADNPCNSCARRKFRGDIVPGIRRGLLHAEGNFFLVLIDSEDNHFHFVTDVDQFSGMINSLGPGHLADVYEALDAILEFHKSAIGHHIDDFAGNT